MLIVVRVGIRLRVEMYRIKMGKWQEDDGIIHPQPVSCLYWQALDYHHSSGAAVPHLTGTSNLFGAASEEEL